MDKFSKFELWKLKIRRKGFNILSSYPLTPEECFPIQSDNEKVEAMFNKYEGGSAYKVKERLAEPRVGYFKLIHKNPKEMIAIISKEGYSSMTQEDFYKNLKELYEPKEDKISPREFHIKKSLPEDIARDLELDKLKIAKSTEEEQEYWGQEYTKCKEDEVYFYNKYIKPEGFPDKTKEDFQKVREFNIGLKKRK